MSHEQRNADSEAARLDAVQQAAYAEGRKDEREQWLPVLEAIARLLEAMAKAEGKA